MSVFWNPKSSQQRCSVKEGFFKSFTNLAGKHLCSSLFLIKLQAFSAITLLKRDSNTGAFLWICKILKNIYFEEHLRKTASGIHIIIYWGQYKPRMRRKWNHTKIIWNLSSCKISLPSFSSRWNSIPDRAYTIISCFPINSGNVERVTGLLPVEIYLFKANNNNSKTKYEICAQF